MSQIVNSGRFQRFDFGSIDKNMDAYGIPSPTEIDLSQINVKIAMFMGQNDVIGNIKDNKEVISQLKNETMIHCQILEGHGHFLLGNRNISFFEDVLNVINEFK